MSIFDLRLINRATLQRIEAQANERGEQLIAQGLPPYTEMTRKGQHWATMATAAVAALVVRPTTAAAFEIYNNTPGLNMVIDSIFTHELVTSTTGLGGGAMMYAMVGPQVAPTDAALAISSLSGGPAAVKTVLTAASQTVVDNGWFPYGSALKKESAGAVVPGGGIYVPIDGKIIVRPGHALCLHVVAGYTGDTFTSGASWCWEPLTLL